MHLWSFHVSSNIPMECGWSSDIGYNIVFVWCSLSFDISIRAEVSTFRKVVVTGHKQPLMGRPREWVLHTNIRIVNLSQSFGYLCSDPILQSNQNIKWSKRTKSNLNSSTSLRCWKNPPSLHQMLQQVLAQTHPHLEQPKKMGSYDEKKPIKEETIRCQVLQLDVMETSNVW